MHFPHAHLRGQADEVGQLRHRFLQPGQPQRHARRGGADLALVGDELAHVADDAREEILATQAKYVSRSAASNDTRNSSSPVSIRSGNFFDFSRVPLVLNNT